MALPPAPQNGSSIIDLFAGAAVAMCSAIFLWSCKKRSECPYLGRTNCEIILCHRLMCNSIPSILGHPDTFVVLREDLVSLSEVAMRQCTVSITRTHWH